MTRNEIIGDTLRKATMVYYTGNDKLTFSTQELFIAAANDQNLAVEIGGRYENISLDSSAGINQVGGVHVWESNGFADEGRVFLATLYTQEQSDGFIFDTMKNAIADFIYKPVDQDKEALALTIRGKEYESETEPTAAEPVCSTETAGLPGTEPATDAGTEPVTEPVEEPTADGGAADNA